MTVRNVNYGKGVASVESDDVEVATLVDRLRTVFGSSAYQPPVMPRVALALQDLFSRSVEDFDQIRQVVETDPLVAAQLMRRASAAVFGNSRVSSLTEALVRLGILGVRDAVWEIVMSMRVFRAPIYSDALEQVRRHSVVTARIARVVASVSGVDAQHTFLCALLHDVGFAAALLVCAESIKPTPHLDGSLARALDAVHVELSTQVTRLWQLPSEISDVIAIHHTLVHRGVVRAVPALIYVADDLSSQLGAPLRIGGGAEIDARSPVLLEQAFAALGLSDVTLKVIGVAALKAAKDPM